MQPQQDKKAAENRSSMLISNEENQQIFRLLGSRCKTMATAVVQLYYTAQHSPDHWLKKDAGVLCFTRDNVRKNYFFRLFCLMRSTMLWEHEIYNNMEYISQCSFFHLFEGENYVYGINFASEKEASDMSSAVNEKLQSKRRRDARLSDTNNSNTYSEKAVPTLPRNDTLKSQTINDSSKKKKRKRNLTKAEIGVPTEFRHISHIGWDKDKGLDIDTTDVHMQQFFKRAGVSEKYLKDKDTRDFIYDFIDKNGGRDAVEKVINKKEPAPVPKSAPGTPVPPVPPRQAPKPPPQRTAPPPPPLQPKAGTIPPPPPENAPPPPALPPAGFVAPPPPPPPPPPLGVESGDDPRSALLDSIRKGRPLKPVDTVEKKPSGKGDLFNEIKKGIQLKPVEEREIREIKPQTPMDEGLDLADALKRALEGRRPVIDSDDDDDDSDTNSNDDEWDA